MPLRLALVLFASAVLAEAALASMPTDGTLRIVLQRTEDGRMLLTDRPVPGARTERSWTVPASYTSAAPEPGLETDPEPAFGTGRIPRHIDPQWRAIGDDAGREHVVRLVLERERAERLARRAAPTAPERALRGSAAPGSR